MASREEELQELAELEELAQLEQLAAKDAQNASLKKPEEQTGLLEKASRVINFTGGLERGAIAGLAEPIVGKDLVSAEQVMSGTVPGSKELAEKAGVDLTYMYPGFVRNLAKMTGQEENLKSLAGATADVALDPATFLAPAARAAQMGAKGAKLAGAKFLETMLDPLGVGLGAVGKGTAAVGEQAYKSAFEKADRALATRYGKGSIADILKGKRFKGSAEDALEATQQINEQLGQKIGSFREAADLSGILEKPIDFKSAEKVVQKYRVASDPKMMAIADSLQETLDSYKGMPPKTASELATIKRTNLDMAGGDTAFDFLKSSPDRAESELRKAIGKSLGEAEDTAVKKALPEDQFKEYLSTKKDYGVTTKFSQKQMSKLATQEANRTGILPSAVDVMGTGVAMAAGSPIGMGAMALKKARDIGRLTSVKTGGGLMLEDIGKQIQQKATMVPPQIWSQMLRPETKEQK